MRLDLGEALTELLISQAVLRGIPKKPNSPAFVVNSPSFLANIVQDDQK
jgi:hypothetical protein